MNDKKCKKKTALETLKVRCQSLNNMVKRE